MKVIGILGFIGSGKNTVASYIRDKYGFHQKSFAGPLKDACSVIFNWPRELLEGDTEQSRIFRELKDEWWSNALGYEITPRLMLQKLGTEAGRDVLGKDIWVSSTVSGFLPGEQYVISDCRFPNEIQAIRACGGKLIWVTRGNNPEWYDCALRTNLGTAIGAASMQERYPDVHISEWAWIGTSFDYVVDNNTNLTYLYSHIDQIMENEKDETIPTNLIHS